MQQLDIDPHEIGTWVSHIKVHAEPLEKVLHREGWANIPRVPVYPLPEGHAHRYVLIDGHARHDGAMRTGSSLPCTLYEPTESVDIERDKLAPFRYVPTFEKILAAYILHTQRNSPT